MAPTTDTLLLTTDSQSSVLSGLDAGELISVAYTVYGARYPQLDLPGFNGEPPEPVTGHYLLGNGYRAFNPVLMRFNSPDSLSPFGEGGLNAYAYCAGDPVNRVDPTGHMFRLLSLRLRRRVQLPRLTIPGNQTVRLPAGPLTLEQNQIVREIDLFINQRPVTQTLAYRSTLAVPLAQIGRPPVPVPPPVLKQLNAAGAQRLAEDRYTQFAKTYRASGSDQEKLAHLRREVWGETADVTVMPSLLKYPPDFAEKLKVIRGNRRMPQY